MTLYTSAMNKKVFSRRIFKTTWVYVAAAAFCVVFDNVYALFGHGVRSNAMSTMFLYPLLLGALIFFALGVLRPQITTSKEYRPFLNLHSAGIALLTAGSVITGILEIAGGSSGFVWMFFAAGWMFLATGVCLLFKALFSR